MEVTYFMRSNNANQPGTLISSEQRTVSGTSAQAGATPAGAKSIRIYTSEAIRVAYSGVDSVAVANGTCLYLPAASEIWLAATPGWKLAAITA